jgi:hypothetical protein
MSASEMGTVRPGLTVGPVSEFSLFFRVKAGEGESVRVALRDLQESPGYRPGDYGMAVATIHERMSRTPWIFRRRPGDGFSQASVTATSLIG